MDGAQDPAILCITGAYTDTVYEGSSKQGRTQIHFMGGHVYNVDSVEGCLYSGLPKPQRIYVMYICILYTLYVYLSALISIYLTLRMFYSGEDMVPEPEEQMETTARSGYGGCFVSLPVSLFVNNALEFKEVEK